jgi:hypothetical protein
MGRRRSSALDRKSSEHGAAAQTLTADGLGHLGTVRQLRGQQSQCAAGQSPGGGCRRARPERLQGV